MMSVIICFGNEWFPRIGSGTFWVEGSRRELQLIVLFKERIREPSFLL